MFGIRDLAQCFKDRMVEQWGEDLFRSIGGEDWDYARRTLIWVYNSVVYYYQPFQRRLEVAKHLLRCTFKWRNGREQWQSIETRIFENRTQDTFQGRKAAIPLLCFTYNPPKWALLNPNEVGRIERHVTKITRHGKKVNSYLPWPVEIAMVLRTKYCRVSGLLNWYYGCVAVVENPKNYHVIPVSSIEAVVQLVPEWEKGTGINNPQVSLVNTMIDLDTYYTIY